MKDTKLFIENRLRARHLVMNEYQKIVDKMFGSGEGKPRIFNYPVEKTDIDVMVVAAYYLGKLETTNSVIDRLDGDA